MANTKLLPTTTENITRAKGKSGGRSFGPTGSPVRKVGKTTTSENPRR